MTRKLTFLILALFALIAGPGWGQSTATATLTTADYTWTCTNHVTSQIVNGITFSFSGGSTDPTYYAADGLRTYEGCNITISSENTISEIVFTYTINNSGCLKNPTVGTWNNSTKTWTGNANSIGLTVGHSSGSKNGQVRITQIVVTYSAGDTPSITVTDNVTLDYDATEGQFDYSISNPATGVNMVASTEDSWISNITVNTSNVTFTTTENEAQTQRVGTITLSYTGATSKAVTVTQAAAPEEGLLFYESFDTNDGTGGNDDKWSGSIASNDLESDNEDWTFVKGNGANKCAKFGTGSAKGSATTPSISYNGDATLTFKAAAWDSNSEGTTLNISATSGTLSQASVTLVKGAWTEYSIDITNVTNSTQITFEAVNASNNRFFLDEVKVVEAEAPSVATPTFTPAAGTYYEAQTVTIECEAEDAIIFYTLDGSTPTIESNIYFFPIEISETTTIKAFAYVDSEVSNVATAKYTIIPLPTYASLAALIDAGEPTTEGTQVNVTLTNETITGIFTTTQGYRNGIFLQVGNQEIEIYCHDVPEDWVIGGTVSGTLENCTWKKFNSTWELCPNSWDALTYTAPQLYKITIDIYPSEYGSVETSPANEAATGTEVTITATPAEHYHLSEIHVYDTGYNVIEVDNNGKFTMPASDVEVYVFFEEDPLCFISYYCNSQIEHVTDWIHAGPIGELREPSESFIPEGFTFAGWSTSMASTTPIDETYNVPEGAPNLYAIFARVEGGSGATTWNLVTDASQISAGDIIKIAATASGANDPDNNGTFAADGIISSSIMGKVNASINNNQLTDEGAAEFTIGGTASEWTLSNGNGELLGATAAKKIAWGGGTTTWTISIDDNAEARISNTETTYGTILYNRDSPRFTTYTSDPTVAMVLPQIFVKTISTVTHYYTRVFQDEYVIDDITIEGPSIIPAGSTLNMGTYSLTSDDPANLIIEDGAQLIQNSSNVKATVLKNITGYSDAASRDGYYLVANPTATVANDEYDALDGCTTFDLYTFNPAAALEWVNIGSTSQKVTFDRKVGYLYANAQDMTLHFRGYLLPAGETEITLVRATEGAGIDFPGFNLIGNPYACNAYVEGYNFYTMVDGELQAAGTRATVAPCEGFFVEATEAGQSVTLSTEAPEAPASTLSLSVNQNRGNVIDRAIVNFNGNNDLHKFMMNPAHTNISLAKNGEEFAAVSASSKSGEMPVNFKAEKNGTYTITVNTENVDAEYLHLIDNKTGMDVDLLASTGSASYTFDAKTSDYASRFKLVFGVNNTDSENSASNFAYMSDGNLVIDNIEGQATLQIIDELGRVISTETVNGSYNKALNLKAGLYILNLNGMTQKIVVK